MTRLPAEAADGEGSARRARGPISVDESLRRGRRRRARRRRQRLRQAFDRVRRVLGLRRTLIVDGVRYRERNAVPLHRALGPGGPGVKEYDVRFPSGARMRIRCTRERVYPDLGLARRVPAYARIGPTIRPGMRALELGCGTGAGARWLADRVGPSGGVVAMDTDRESVRFARRRYPCDHLGFEYGWVESLAGELDGAFEVVAAVAPLERSLDAGAKDALDAPGVLRELWRVVAPGGVLLVLGTAGPDRGLAGKALSEAVRSVTGADAEIEVLGTLPDGAPIVAASRPEPPEPES